MRKIGKSTGEWPMHNIHARIIVVNSTCEEAEG